MSQRRFRINISRTTKSVFSTFAIGTILLFPRVAPAQDNLDIAFEWITADSNITIKGKRPMFPYPVMSLVTVKNQNGMYIHGLADTARWLGPSDTTLSGQIVNDIWQTILEYHVEDTTFPAQNDVKQPDPPAPDSLDFMVTEYSDLGVSVGPCRCSDPGRFSVQRDPPAINLFRPDHHRIVSLRQRGRRMHAEHDPDAEYGNAKSSRYHAFQDTSPSLLQVF